MKFDHSVDATGLLCPLPLLKSKRQLNQMDSGQVLQVIATDSNAEQDLRKFCEQSGDTFLAAEPQDDCQLLYLQKK
ncbi:MAG TPA: sulfurtransferase TusA family protein [Gammaproteobacteria bacterium]|nr:sulfurtransferase TusA family protein [Gammaproteobacteria bacterium]